MQERSDGAARLGPEQDDVVGRRRTEALETALRDLLEATDRLSGYQGTPEAINEISVSRMRARRLLDE